MLDEPAPPPPPEPREDDGRDDSDPHFHHISVELPTFGIYTDSRLGIVMTGWLGSLIGLSMIVASFVVLWQALGHVLTWIVVTSVYGVSLLYVALVVIGAFIAFNLVVGAAALVLWLLTRGGKATVRWWRGRRARRTAA